LFGVNPTDAHLFDERTRGFSVKCEQVSVERVFDPRHERLYDDTMAEKTISRRQREILEFIVSQTREQGFPPSVREIGLAVGLTSPSTVHSHLNTLT
jgi:repressor LexA